MHTHTHTRNLFIKKKTEIREQGPVKTETQEREGEISGLLFVLVYLSQRGRDLFEAGLTLLFP